MYGSKAFLGALALAIMLPAAARAAGITGTVFAGDSATAAANATVVLTAPGTGGAARAPVDTAQTDAQGKFSFASLAIGDNYGVTISAAGFNTYTNNNIDLPADTSAAALTVVLAVTPPPAAISGTIVGADTVTPVANATVVLTRAGAGGFGARTPVDTLQSDAQGKFSFPDLAAADNYGLTVTATGFVTYTNNNIDLRGKDTALVIRIAPPPPAAAISGTVVGADSVTALPNATVVLTRAGAGGGARTPVDTLQSDAQGKFSFPGLAAADNYGLTVTATGYLTYTNNNIDLAGRDTSLTIPLALIPPPGNIVGTVFGADSSTAVNGATVILNRTGGGGGARAPVDTVQTDAQGKFSFPGVAAAQNYGIIVVATGFQPYTNNNIDVNGGDTVTANVRLVPPGAPGTIAGTVRGPAGPNAAAIANATVILRSPLLLGGLPIDTVQTDTGGRFSFPAVPSMDNYVVSVTAAGFNPATNNNVDLDSADTATVNFTLVLPTSVFRLGKAEGVFPTWKSGVLAIRFPAGTGSRVLAAYASNGAMRYRTAVPAQGGWVALPEGLSRQPGLILMVSGSGERTHLRVPAR